MNIRETFEGNRRGGREHVYIDFGKLLHIISEGMIWVEYFNLKVLEAIKSKKLKLEYGQTKPYGNGSCI